MSDPAVEVVFAFEGEASDRELYALYPVLQKLSSADDIRPAQKQFVEHKARVSLSTNKQTKSSQDFDECGIDLDEGCRKAYIRTFECRSTMMRYGNQLVIQCIC